jgi:AraC-like DNA-binding protein
MLPGVTQGAWRGRIFLDVGTILYVGPGASADQHAHAAVQLVWSPHGSFEIAAGGGWLRRSAVLVPSATVHQLDASGCEVAVFLVESHGARGAALDRLARREGCRELAAELADLPFPARDLEGTNVAAFCDRVLAALGVTATAAPTTAITRRAIAHIERHLDGVPRVGDVARELAVSSSRVTHLFSAEVGVPFRKFVLWTRIKRAVEAHHAGFDLGASAIAAGFSDAAHFSRSFRAMFGLSPSLILPFVEITGRA